LEAAALLAAVNDDALLGVQDLEELPVQLIVVDDKVQHPLLGLVLPRVDDAPASRLNAGVWKRFGGRSPAGVGVVHQQRRPKVVMSIPDPDGPGAVPDAAVVAQGANQVGVGTVRRPLKVAWVVAGRAKERLDAVDALRVAGRVAVDIKFITKLIFH